MAKPVILAIDDEIPVLNAVARDLQQAYGNDFRIIRADSGQTALETVRQLKLRDEPVALFVVDQRMPAMSGVEFLREAIELYPNARRVLLTAYADTEAAIRAINEVRLDHYLMKPWDPPEERLYPVLNDLLDEWQATYVPPFDGIRVVGTQLSPFSHQIKDFLARNLIPYKWLDIEANEENRQLVDLVGADASQLPVVLFPDGSYLLRPSNSELAQKIGLRTRAGAPFYDLIIVGAGPAGLAAAVYGASEGLRTLVIEREAPGGQAGLSSSIENYLGFPSGLSGSDLTRRAVSQAARFGAEILTPVEVAGLRPQDRYRIITLSDGTELNCNAVLIATGASYRKLDLPNIDRLTGAGVYYGAALTEALAYQGKDVFIVGGGNSAGQAALYLAKFAKSVTMLVRNSSLNKANMSQYLELLIASTPNIKVWLNSHVSEVHGERYLEAITVVDDAAGETQTIPTPALFIFIGAVPHTGWLEGTIQTGPQGFILTGTECSPDDKRPRGWTLPRNPFWLETSMPGVFVAGDVRYRSVKRIASAVGEGAMAVQFIHQHLSSM